ncbi:MAG TPA: methionine biosynthesis protein MetW [Deltaproteobacteria bacterium]|nr:methionine biosynthesis protein MetW [Deltaproteobacteria bacterium]
MKSGGEDAIDVIIEGWVAQGSRVLDLGCGDGSLLRRLVTTRHVEGIGVEISQDMVIQCLKKGLCVYQADIDKGLAQWDDLSFDTVILKSTLDVIRRPCELLGDMLRVGRNAVVTVSNFGYAPNRMHILLKGSVSPRSRSMKPWHATEVIRYVCLAEFLDTLVSMGIDAIDSRYVLPFAGIVEMLPPLSNVLVREAIFLLGRSA